jgi:N-acetylmuramoyl-L-alanine amidase
MTAALVLFVLASGGLSAHATPTVAKTATVTGDSTRTQFTLDLSVGVKAEIFTLADPWRVVVELPAVTFNLAPGTGSKPTGLISAFRYGSFAQDRARVVIDTSGPVLIDKADMQNIAGGVRLSLLMVPIDAATFGSGTGAMRKTANSETGPAPKAMPPDGLPVVGLPGPAVSSPRAKPLIMIDPGHGGVDPGAIGAGKTTEKAVVLAVAWQLKRALDATGKFETRLTRSTDVFVALDKRVIMSEEALADLFVSLHADAIDDSAAAQSASGASIYTLSERASDEQARKMAEKENSADLIAGIGQRKAQASDEVKGILTDLWARETSTFSHMFSKSLAGALGRMNALARQGERSAAFRVLKQAHAPAVLIELGFLSNPADETRMASPAWQKQIASSIATAIATFFERRNANATASPRAPARGGQPP